MDTLYIEVGLVLYETQFRGIKNVGDDHHIQNASFCPLMCLYLHLVYQSRGACVCNVWIREQSACMCVHAPPAGTLVPSPDSAMLRKPSCHSHSLVLLSWVILTTRQILQLKISINNLIKQENMIFWYPKNVKIMSSVCDKISQIKEKWPMSCPVKTVWKVFERQAAGEGELLLGTILV